jgi:hypothetical protein
MKEAALACITSSLNVSSILIGTEALLVFFRT